MGKGLGYKYKVYQKIDKSEKFDSVFSKVNTKDFKNEESLVLVAGMLQIVQQVLAQAISFGSADALFNHLSAMVKRIENNDLFENPFHYETKALYPQSYQMADLIAKQIERELKFILPEAETDFLTLYVQTIQHKDEETNVKFLNKIIYQISAYLEEEWKFTVDKSSLSYARFITHIKFVIMRLSRLENLPKVEITEVLFVSYQSYIPIARGIGAILGNSLKVQISDDEIAYIIVHLVRLQLFECEATTCTMN